MKDRYGLRGLGNDQLLASLSALVQRENDCLSDLLAHLAELDERGLCLELGYSSLFKYCTDALGFCESAAGRRIAAARVCRKFPEAFARVANGELKLSVLVALNKYLNLENAAELIAACSRKSYEQVELLLAARFPKRDVRDLVRRLPVRTGNAPHIDDIGSAGADGASARASVSAATGSNAPQSEPQSAVRSERAAQSAVRSERGVGAKGSRAAEPPAVRPDRPGVVKPLSPQRFSVNFTADAEFRELLEEVRALVSHAEPRGDLMTVMKRGLQALKAELLKKRFGVGRKPRRVRSKAEGAGSAARSRYVTADLKREVWARDEGRCTFCSAGGRRCSERRLLQLDHIRPFAAGGEATLDNLRVRCRAHNLHAARVHFGAKFMRAARLRSRCAGALAREESCCSAVETRLGGAPGARQDSSD